MRSLILSAGRSCFVACRGCYNHFASHLLPTSTVLRFVSDLQEHCGLSKITVGGGDPLTRPDLSDLLGGLRALDLRISLDTVGTAFLRDAPIRFMGQGTTRRIDTHEVASLCDVIGIPLDGTSDETIRTFRAHGSLADQHAILTLLDQVGTTVCVNTVVHAANHHDLHGIAEHVNHHPSVREWQLFQFMPIGPIGWRNRDRFTITEQAFEHAVNGLAELLPGKQVTAKSAAARKNRYLLVDTAGAVWIPRQSNRPRWAGTDENDERHLLGRVNDLDIITRIDLLHRADMLEEAS